MGGATIGVDLSNNNAIIWKSKSISCPLARYHVFRESEIIGICTRVDQLCDSAVGVLADYTAPLCFVVPRLSKYTPNSTSHCRGGHDVNQLTSVQVCQSYAMERQLRARATALYA
jgi:hypothetical protein